MSKRKKKVSLTELYGEDRVLSISEAAKISDVTRQAIYVAIKLNKLKAAKVESNWKIQIKDLEEYRKSRYSRSKSVYQGELIFDHTKGYYSINDTAKMLGVPTQTIYYATRSKKMAAQRKGSAWVVHVDEIENYRKQHLTTTRKKRAS